MLLYIVNLLTFIIIMSLSLILTKIKKSRKESLYGVIIIIIEKSYEPNIKLYAVCFGSVWIYYQV